MEHGKITSGIVWLVLSLGAVARAAEISSVDPRTGAAADSAGRGGTTLAVKGTGFTETMSLRLAAGATEKALLGLSLDARTQTFTGRIPFLPPGTYDLKLYSGRLLQDTLAKAVLIVEPLNVTSVEPRNLKRAGGDTVLVHGVGFKKTTEVHFGVHPLESPAVSADGTAIKGIAPALDAGEPDGPYDVTANDGGLSDTLAGGVIYQADPVQLVKVIPGVIDTAGGTPVTFLGRNFKAGMGLDIDGKAVTGVAFVDAFTLTGIAPALPAGFYDASVVIVGAARVVLATLTEAVEARDPIPDPLEAALRKLRGESGAPARIRFVSGFPRGVYGRFPSSGGSAPERALSFLKAHEVLYGLDGKKAKLFVRRVDPPAEDDGGKGPEFVYFRQKWGGVQVHGAGLLVALMGNDVVFTVGKILGETARVETKPVITGPDAEAAAKAAAGLSRVIGETRLVLFDRALLGRGMVSDPHLVYRVSLAGKTQKRVFIDALTGEKVFAESLASEHGGGLNGFDYDLWDAENESTADGDCHWLSSDTHIATESNFESDYLNDVDATGADTFIRQTYRFYHNNFNRHSWNGDYAHFEIFIHSPVGAAIAAWYRWPCNLIDMENGSIDREVITHEFTHGVIQATSGLGHSMDPGALNEHYADVMSLIHDRGADIDGGLTPDWTVGEGRTSGAGAVRDFEHGTPDRYLDVDYGDEDSPGYDNGQVHKNANLGNKAVYLMMHGGVNHGVDAPGGLSLEKAKRHQYAALQSVPEDADYEDAAATEKYLAKLFVATGLHGFTQDDYCAVEGGWAAVGLGLDDLECGALPPDFDGDGVPDYRDNCKYEKNPAQSDMDYDGIGDACDPDIDGDGFKNDKDHCPTQYSPFNGYCGDYDNDVIDDHVDNCPDVPNFLQEDTDGDGIGDACEPDSDGDGVDEDHDNCPKTANPGQENSDGDFFGDACDLCPTVTDPIAAYTPWGTPFQPDSDDDGIPDACDGKYKTDGKTGYDMTAVADTSSHHLAVQGSSRTISTIPVLLCPHGDCPEWYDPFYRIGLNLKGAGPHVKFWLTDDEGVVVAESYQAGGADLKLKPLGGATYYLNVDFGPDFPGGMAEFDVQMKELPSAPEPVTFKRGDSNGDGKVDLSDAVATLGFLFVGGVSVGCLDAADSNDDDALNLTDGIFTLAFLFQGGAPIPQPGKDDCGLDPGPGLGCQAYDGCGE